MTVYEYNHIFYRAVNCARTFVNCVDNAIEKSGEETATQMKIIGWNSETKKVLLKALECFQKEALEKIGRTQDDNICQKEDK